MIRRRIFDEEHDMFRDSVRKWMADHVAPHREAWHEAGVVDREVWRKARAVVLESDQPALLAHDFMQLTSGLFYQAAWARIAQVTRSEELLALAELVLAPERKWMT